MPYDMPYPYLQLICLRSLISLIRLAWLFYKNELFHFGGAIYACSTPWLMENLGDRLSQTDPSLRNSTINNEDLGKLRTLTTVICVINACSSIAATLGNGLILFVVWRSPSLHSPSNTLLFGLALTDFFVGILIQPLQVAIYLIYLIKDESGPQALTTAFDVLSVILSTASFTTATLISIDKFLLFYLHMRYKTLVTCKRVIAIIVVGWLSSCMLGFIWTQSTQAYYYAAVIAFVISFFIIVFMYSKIFRIVRRHQAQIQAQCEVGTQQNASSQGHFARCTKSAINTFYVCFLLFLCYFPYSCTVGVIQLTGNSIDKVIALQFAGTVIFLNSSINPLVYFWRVGEIRKAVKSTLNDNFVSARVMSVVRLDERQTKCDWRWSAIRPSAVHFYLNPCSQQFLTQFF